jgi:breast cancer 2 susceptibility protein
MLTRVNSYEREVNKAKRSALKIILERDESAGRSMVLCVAAIRSYGGDPPPSSTTTATGRSPSLIPPPPRACAADALWSGTGGAESSTIPEGAGGGIIEVTDGWYSINAVLDEALTQHMALGKIYPGLKIRVIGARVRVTSLQHTRTSNGRLLLLTCASLISCAA